MKIDDLPTERLREMIWVYGLTRSGNHAIVDWIGARFPGSVHHNNYLPSKDLPDIPPEGKEIITFENKTEIPDTPGQRVVVCRSFYNMMASKICYCRDQRRGTPDWSDQIELWPYYIENATIFYDKWLIDPYYLLKVEWKYGWSHHERLPSLAWVGSSFGDSTVEPDRLLSRWRLMKRDEDWDQVLKDDKCRLINLRYFGWSLNRNGELIWS